MNELEGLLANIPKHKDDAGWDDDETLSKLVVRISVYLLTLATQIAEAELVEVTTKVGYLELNNPAEKKMTATEAEARAIMDTGNKYKSLKLTYDSLIEVINTLKKRLDTRGYERRLT